MRKLALLIVAALVACAAIWLWFARGASWIATADTTQLDSSLSSSESRLGAVDSPVAGTARTSHAPPDAPTETPATAREDAGLRIELVTEEDGAPLAQASLVVRLAGSVAPGTPIVAGARAHIGEIVASDELGLARFVLPSGVALELTVEHRALAAAGVFAVAPLGAGEARTLRIAVRSADAATLRAQVVDEATGAPLAAARAAIVSFANTGPPSEATAAPDAVFAHALSDSAGYFELPFARWREGVLQVEADGHGRKLVRLDERVLGAREDVVIALPRSATLVVHARGVARLSDARLIVGVAAEELAWLPETEWNRWGGAQYWTRGFDAGERAELVDLPPGVDLWLGVRSGAQLARRPTEPVRLGSGETREVELDVAGGVRLVVDARSPEGAPERVDVLLCSTAGQLSPIVEYPPPNARRASTDATGRAEFESVAPGDWLLVPWSGDSAAPAAKRIAPWATLVRIEPPASEQRCELVVQRGNWIRGTVVGADGATRAQEWVVARSAALGSELSTTSESDGSFALGPLVPGRYEVAAGGIHDAQGAPVEVDAPAGGLELRTQTGCKLTVRFVDREGAAVPAAVAYWRANAARRGHTVMWTEVQGGQLEIDDVPPGALDVFASTADGLAGADTLSVAAESGEPPATVTLVRGARLRLLRAPAFGICIARAGERWVGMEAFGTRGAPALTVPAGHIRLTLELTGEPSERSLELDVAAGETRDVDLALAR